MCVLLPVSGPLHSVFPLHPQIFYGHPARIKYFLVTCASAEHKHSPYLAKHEMKTSYDSIRSHSVLYTM